MQSHPNILIIGSSSDAHVLKVCEYLPQSVIPLVIDFSKFPRHYRSSVKITSGGVSTFIAEPGGDLVYLDGVRSVWWRRPLAYNLQDLSDDQLRLYVMTQCEFFWSGLLSCLPHQVAWYNDRFLDFSIDRNIKQLRIAEDIGFKVPDTLVTNDPIEARDFISKHSKVVFKAYGGSRTIWHPTRLLTDDMLTKLPYIANCPVIFQAFVHGVREYRVTVIDNNIEAVEFDSTNSSYPFDIRIDKNIECRRVVLPSDICKQIQKLVSKCQLRFSAIDLKVGCDNEWYFFELNPAGQFVYLDNRAGTQIAKTFASCLASHCTSDDPDLDTRHSNLRSGYTANPEQKDPFATLV